MIFFIYIGNISCYYYLISLKLDRRCDDIKTGINSYYRFLSKSVSEKEVAPPCHVARPWISLMDFRSRMVAHV